MNGEFKMKKWFLVCSMILLISGFAHVATAVTITYDSIAGEGGTLTTVYDWAIVETFDGDELLWGWEGSGKIVQGSKSGKYAAPGLTDITQYVSVPDPDGADSNGYYKATFGGVGVYNYFGLFWGSVDNYNTLTFLKGGIAVAAYSGTAITAPNPANGNQTAPSTNLYVNFFDLPEFDSFMMTSAGFAFEADNIAVGVAPVPEPATLLLLGSGLLGLAASRRKKSA
jgi:hypothetical protein